MAAFFLDTDFHAGIGRWLRDRGHSVMSARDARPSLAPATDREILLAAAYARLILLTHNERDFIDLHETGGVDHAGILTVPQVSREEVPTIAQAIHDLVNAHGSVANELWRFDFLSGWGP